MKMKVGIITIIDNNNYGNRLQCYAVQKILKKLGIKAETIYYGSGLNIKQKNYLVVVKKFVRAYYKELKENFNNLLHFKRAKNFRFFNKNIKMVNKRTLLYRKNSHKEYDYFLVGSDQIWNPNFGRFGDVEFLTFVPKEKRIAYVPSFGVSTIEEKKEEFCRKPLKEFKAISVREESGKEIIEKLTSRKDIEVLIDPTMVLTSEEWKSLERKPKCLKINNFILCYFLGQVSENKVKYIENEAKRNKCAIINLNNKNNEFYNVGPAEFIYLIRNAKVVFTDSFHACVFSILFKKDFIVFDRESKGKSMYSRIDTLLEKFNLKDRKYNEKEILQPIDYSFIDNIIEEEREKTYKFLNKALKS